MATINEEIVTGRKFRKLIDEATKLWQRISFWTRSSDVEFDDGENAETKVGAIKGITTDTNVTVPGYAADMTVVSQLYSNISSIKTDLQGKMSLDTYSKTLGGDNGTQSWGRIDKVGRIAMLTVNGYTNKVFADNTAYTISQNIHEMYHPLYTWAYSVPRGNWENGNHNILELAFKNESGKVNLKITPLNGEIPNGGYIHFAITYITKQ